MRRLRRELPLDDPPDAPTSRTANAAKVSPATPGRPGRDDPARPVPRRWATKLSDTAEPARLRTPAADGASNTMERRADEPNVSLTAVAADTCRGRPVKTRRAANGSNGALRRGDSPDGAYGLSVALTPAASGSVVRTRRRRMSGGEAADHARARRRVSFPSPGWDAGFFYALFCASMPTEGIGPEPFWVSPRLNYRTPFGTPKQPGLLTANSSQARFRLFFSVPPRLGNLRRVLERSSGECRATYSPCAARTIRGEQVRPAPAVKPRQAFPVRNP
jgi:hypothetical protein